MFNSCGNRTTSYFILIVVTVSEYGGSVSRQPLQVAVTSCLQWGLGYFLLNGSLSQKLLPCMQVAVTSCLQWGLGYFLLNGSLSLKLLPSMQVAFTSCFTQRVQLFSVAPLTETVALYSCGFSNYFTQRVYLLNPPVIMKFLPFIAGGFYQLFYTKSLFIFSIHLS